MVAVLGTAVFVPPNTTNTNVYKGFWDVLQIPREAGLHGEDDGLYRCHIDVSYCLWTFIIPCEFWGTLCVSDGEARGGLPFGPKFNPLLCQHVLGELVASACAQDVVILVYLDDVLILGRGVGEWGPRWSWRFIPRGPLGHS